MDTFDLLVQKETQLPPCVYMWWEKGWWRPEVRVTPHQASCHRARVCVYLILSTTSVLLFLSCHIQVDLTPLRGLMTYSVPYQWHFFILSPWQLQTLSQWCLLSLIFPFSQDQPPMGGRAFWPQMAVKGIIKDRGEWNGPKQMLHTLLLGHKDNGCPLHATDKVTCSQHPYHKGEKGAGLGSPVPMFLLSLHVCGFSSSLNFS